MFCYQCQETAGCSACTQGGVCGKNAHTAALQDLLIEVTRQLSTVTTALRAQEQVVEPDIDTLVTDNLFVTITNANFDDTIIEKRIQQTIASAQTLAQALTTMPILWDGTGDWKRYAAQCGVMRTQNEDIRSLRELITYGLKGMAAYNHHINALGKRVPEIDQFIQKALAATGEDLSVDQLIALTMQTGQYGVTVMAALDEANTSAYGHPEITHVQLGVRNRPAILISGHDLHDLQMLLEQTIDTGVDVYTHSEMLPAHYYPAFKKYPHFVGNYGNAWWKQTEEFESFNGPIILTTNCLVPPRASYRNRVYTTGAVGFPGCVHIDSDASGQKDFSAVIAHAKTCAPPVELERGEIIGGFAHNQVLALADKVVEAVKTGAIRKFVVMAGCDGRAKARSYYTDFALALPKDTIILTAGCAKYKYNKLNLGDIGGIPRVLDAGQCNDSYSLIKIACKLKEVLEQEDINDLPIVYNIAWYEQKAVIVLLALLHLGVKNIRLGPTLPAFLSQNVVQFLVEQFHIESITTVQQDMEKMIGNCNEN